MKLAKITNTQTGTVDVFEGTDTAWAQKQGFTPMNVEQSTNGFWYLKGYAPAAPEKTYAEKRVAEYPSIQEQLDMQYWDSVNGTSVWKDTISAIKEKYPKPTKEA